MSRMTRNLRTLAPRFGAGPALALAGAMLWACPAAAASMSYGDYAISGTGFSFVDVTESSGTDPVPLFDVPTPLPVGLNFAPTQFLAQTAGGGADITDGQLNFSIVSQQYEGQTQAIDVIRLNEAGLGTLLGAGGVASQWFAGAIMFVTVTEIDGAAVAPIRLAPASATVQRNLAADGPGLDPWALTVELSVAAALLDLGHSFDVGATRLDVVLDNTLVAISESTTTALVAKNSVTVTILPSDDGGVPEPATVTLALAGLAGAAARRRRRGGTC